MKTFLHLFITLFLAGTFSPAQLFAQEAEKTTDGDGEVRVTVYQMQDGEMVRTDTVITTNGDEAIAYEMEFDFDLPDSVRKHLQNIEVEIQRITDSLQTIDFSFIDSLPPFPDICFDSLRQSFTFGVNIPEIEIEETDNGRMIIIKGDGTEETIEIQNFSPEELQKHMEVWTEKTDSMVSTTWQITTEEFHGRVPHIFVEPFDNEWENDSCHVFIFRNGETFDNYQKAEFFVLRSDRQTANELMKRLEEKMENIDDDDYEIERDTEENQVYIFQSDDEKVIVIELVTIEDLTADDEKMLEEQGVTTGIDQLNDENLFQELRFYPNPNNGIFTIELASEEISPVEIRVFDTNGRLVYNETETNFTGNYQKEIDITSYGTGTYFLQIVKGSHAVTKKLIVQ